MKITKHHVLVAALLLGCGSKQGDPEASEPVTCAVAGQMVAKRLGEFADRAKVTGEKRLELDQGMAAAAAERCTADAWNEAALGCLGAMATIREGELKPAVYNDGIDICMQAIGDDKMAKLQESVGKVIRGNK